MNNFEGVGGHCFEDCVLKERGSVEHTDPIVVDIATGGCSEGAKGVSAYVSWGNDVGCELSAFGLGGYGNVDIESDDLGIGPIPKRAATLMVGWRIFPL